MFVYPGGSAGRAQTVFEIVVAKAGQRLGGAVFMQYPDIRQGHPVEGVVLAIKLVICCIIFLYVA